MCTKTQQIKSSAQPVWRAVYQDQDYMSLSHFSHLVQLGTQRQNVNFSFFTKTKTDFFTLRKRESIICFLFINKRQNVQNRIITYKKKVKTYSKNGELVTPYPALSLSDCQCVAAKGNFFDPGTCDPLLLFQNVHLLAPPPGRHTWNEKFSCSPCKMD